MYFDYLSVIRSGIYDCLCFDISYLILSYPQKLDFLKLQIKHVFFKIWIAGPKSFVFC